MAVRRTDKKQPTETDLHTTTAKGKTSPAKEQIRQTEIYSELKASKKSDRQRKKSTLFRGKIDANIDKITIFA